jgi:hypothetical protein
VVEEQMKPIKIVHKETIKDLRKKHPASDTDGAIYECYNGEDLVESQFVAKEDQAEWISTRREAGYEVRLGTIRNILPA